MKRFLAIVGAIIMLSSFSEAEAGHIWVSDYDGFNYTVYENGGDFYYFNATPLYYNTNSTGVPPGGESSPSFSTPAITTNDEFVSPPGSMSLHGMAGGNLSGDDITVVKAYAGIDFTSELNESDRFNADHHGVQVRQNVAASIQRIFRVDIDGYCDLAAAITGPVNFNTFGDNSGSHYADYQLTGNVSILEFRENTGGVASSATIALNDQMRNDEIEGFPVFAPQGTGNDIYYKIFVGLLLNTEVQNIDYQSWGSFALDGPFQLGDGIDDPLVLSASISTRAVPIPGTVFLLLSGLGGLTLMRRRFLRT